VDIFDEEILNFWRALQECDVKYIMVGGYAANSNKKVVNRSKDQIDVLALEQIRQLRNNS